MDLDQFIDRAKHLPPAPTLLPELLSLLDRPDIDIRRIIRLVTHDPTLTANVLRLSNSALLASAQPVSTVKEAVLRLGFHPILRLVVVSCGAYMMRGGGVRKPGLQQQLWSHSVVSAIGAQKVAKACQLDENIAFTAGLLHDIGKVIMLDVLDAKYSRLLQEAQVGRHRLLDSEQSVFGLDHAQLGGRLLARWSFPMILIAAVCFHHNPAAAAPHEKIAACVCLGDLMADRLGYACGNPNPPENGIAAACDLLQIAPDSETECLESIREGFTAVQALIQI